MVNQTNPCGAWERQVARRHRQPIFFFCSIPEETEFTAARQRDQLELAQFNQQVAGIASELGSVSGEQPLRAILRRVEHCYDQSCGLAGNLQEARRALLNLHRTIATTLLKTLPSEQKNAARQLKKKLAERERYIARLQFPIVADLARVNSPIDQGDIAAALLCETTPAIRAASESFSVRRLLDIIAEMRLIHVRCHNQSLKQQVERKVEVVRAMANSIAERNRESSTRQALTH